MFRKLAKSRKSGPPSREPPMKSRCFASYVRCPIKCLTCPLPRADHSKNSKYVRNSFHNPICLIIGFVPQSALSPRRHCGRVGLMLKPCQSENVDNHGDSATKAGPSRNLNESLTREL